MHSSVLSDPSVYALTGVISLLYGITTESVEWSITTHVTDQLLLLWKIAKYFMK